MTFAELWNGLNQNTDTTAGVVLSQSRLHALLKDTWITAHIQGHNVGQKRGLRLAEQKARTDAEKLFKKTFPQSVMDN